MGTQYKQLTEQDHVFIDTFDQRSEFKKFEWIKECIGADIYFCEPASPEQKGCIENGNANIRIEFQRECDQSFIKQKNINNVITQINNRPLKDKDFYPLKEIL